jgi:U3 small nucleolar RNA-associated protein 19
MEDFLDHSYGTMLDAELSRQIKREPIIDHERPHGLMGEGTNQDGILARLWEF